MEPFCMDSNSQASIRRAKRGGSPGANGERPTFSNLFGWAVRQRRFERDTGMDVSRIIKVGLFYKTNG